jgi:hypothetical protein
MVPQRRLPLWSALFAALVLLLGLACGGLEDSLNDLKGHPPPDEAWVGEWTGDNAFLVITRDGMVHWETRGRVNQSLDMPAQAWEADSVTLGIGFIANRYEVTPPAPSVPDDPDATWTLTWDGHQLTRTSTEVTVDPRDNTDFAEVDRKRLEAERERLEAAKDELRSLQQATDEVAASRAAVAEARAAVAEARAAIQAAAASNDPADRDAARAKLDAALEAFDAASAKLDAAAEAVPRAE